MGSNDTVRSYAEACLVLIGISALLLALNKLFFLPAAPLEFSDSDELLRDLRGALTFVSAPVLLGVFATALIRSREQLADRICRPVSGASATWEPVAYRLVFLAMGLLLLFWACSGLALMGEQFAQMTDGDLPQVLESAFWSGLWPSLVHNLVRLAFGAYLLAGAPRFLRWQMLRSKTNAISDGEPTTAPQSEDDQAEVSTSRPHTSCGLQLSWIRAGLVLLGIVAISLVYQQLDGLVSFYWRVCTEDWDIRMVLAGMVTLFICPVPLLLAAAYLIRDCDSLTKRISGAHDVASRSEEAAYAMGVTAAGVFVIAVVFPAMVSGLVNITVAACNPASPIDESIVPRGNPWIFWTYSVVRTGFGVFLVWSAPWLIKWQVQPSAVNDPLQSADRLEQNEEERCRSDEGV